MSLLVASLILLSQMKPVYLVSEGQIIGYRTGTRWHDGTSLSSRKHSLSLTRVGVGTLPGKTWSSGWTHEINGPEAVFLEGDLDNYKGILFSGRATVPRKVKVLSNRDSDCLKALTAFLKNHGISGKPRITLAAQADLAGDGSIETIVEASSRDDLTQGGMSEAKKGDYSIVLLQWRRNGKAQSTPLEFDHPKPGGMPFMNKLAAIADFESHGRMDIAMTSSYYEGRSTTLISWQNGKPRKLIENGVGA